MVRLKVIFLALFFLFSSFFKSFSQEEGLIFHWSFDALENEQFKDHVSDELKGIAFYTQSVPGIKGNALKFNGKTSYARIPGDQTLPPAILKELGKGSISIWFKVDSIPLEHGIAPLFYYGDFLACSNMFDASNKGLIIEVGHSPVHFRSSRLYFTIFSNDCGYPTFCYDSWSGLETGKWYHFVAVVGEDYNTGYLNGVEMTERHYNFGSPQTSQFFEDALSHEAFWLGKGYWDGEPKFLKGAIDELKIYNKALSSEEVNNLYLEGEITAVPTNIFDRNLTVFPNPVYNRMTIQSDEQPVQMQYSIYNSVAKLVLSGDIDSATAFIDVSQLQPGVYYFYIQNGNSQTLKKKMVVL